MINTAAYLYQHLAARHVGRSPFGGAVRTARYDRAESEAVGAPVVNVTFDARGCEYCGTVWFDANDRVAGFEY